MLRLEIADSCLARVAFRTKGLMLRTSRTGCCFLLDNAKLIITEPLRCTAAFPSPHIPSCRHDSVPLYLQADALCLPTASTTFQGPLQAKKKLHYVISDAPVAEEFLESVLKGLL
eukprot:IDg16854t1